MSGYDEVQSGSLKLKGILLKKEKTKRYFIYLCYRLIYVIRRKSKKEQNDHQAVVDLEPKTAFVSTKTNAELVFQQTQKKRVLSLPEYKY